MRKVVKVNDVLTGSKRINVDNVLESKRIKVESTLTLSKFVGAHVSGAGGLHHSVENAIDIGGSAFALFLKSQRRWISPPLDPSIPSQFNSLIDTHGFDKSKIVPHGSYLVNLASPNPELAQKSYDNVLEDLKRCGQLGIVLWNFHPGNATDGDKEGGILRVIDAVDRLLLETSEHPVTILFENMAYKGNVLGNCFEDLKKLIEGVKEPSRVGVCLDTCHLFASGYDIRTRETYEETMTLFDSIVGFEHLKAVHLNDSKGELGSHKDRHENIGKGCIGLDAFKFIMNDPRFDNIPMVLETPLGAKDDTLVWKEEISLLYSLLDSPLSSKEELK